MDTRPAATLGYDSLSGTGTRPTPNPAAPLLVATVDGSCPPLRDVDWIRIDGAMDPLSAARARERHAESPALFDIPGPATPRRSFLTATEYLVFAAAHEFGWVNLRDVDAPDEVDRARTFLPQATKLTASIHSSVALRRGLDLVAHECDAVILHLDDLIEDIGREGAERAARIVLARLEEYETPALLMLGPAQFASNPGRHTATLDGLESHLHAGYRGLVLDDLGIGGANTQACVDLVRDLFAHATDVSMHRGHPATRRGTSGAASPARS